MAQRSMKGSLDKTDTDKSDDTDDLDTGITGQSILHFLGTASGVKYGRHMFGHHENEDFPKDKDGDTVSSSVASLGHKPEMEDEETDNNELTTVQSAGSYSVLGRLFDAQSQVDGHGRSISHPHETPKDIEKQDKASLAQKLKEVFGFLEEEDFVAEYPCWLFKSVLLQGYMYITTNHISFYAYLPMKESAVFKSGHFQKKARNTPRFTRYWFVLKNDVLSYYQGSSNLYFPSGSINLGNAIQATNKESKDKHFQLITNRERFHFIADSLVSANEWVKALQRVIFRSHNNGDSVKVSLPIENVLDIEQAPALDFADTVKVKAIDNEDTYAIDEYFFSFFEQAQEAFASLTQASKVVAEQRKGSRSGTFSELDRYPRSQQLRHRVNTTEITSMPTSPNKSFGSKLFDALAIDNIPAIPRLDKLHNSSNEQVSKHLKALSLEGPNDHSQLTDEPMQLEDMSSGTWNIARESITNQASQGTGFQTSLHMKDSWGHWMRRRTQRMQSMFAIPPSLFAVPPLTSLNYIEKVSGLWSRSSHPEMGHWEDEGSYQHFTEHEEQRHRMHFTLPESEKLQATFYGFLYRVLPLHGKIYISKKYICYRSLIPATRTKLILPLTDIENVEKQKGFRLGWSGLVLVVRGHEDLFFEFHSRDDRDECAVTLLRILETEISIQSNENAEGDKGDAAARAKEEHEQLKVARKLKAQDHPCLENPRDDMPPIIFDSPQVSMMEFKPSRSFRFTCLTIGSRGDVQPYIALCIGLKADGHKVKIATHDEFKPWIEKHGIEFARVDGDPAELMRICVENGMFTYSFLKEASSKFRGWIDSLLSSAWDACQNTDILIESPSAMAGIHIAEALEIPYFRAFTMPWTRTRAYPHAFAVPEHKLGGSYNYYTYVMFDNIFWKATAGQINRWREKTLSLPHTTLDKLRANKVPFMYNFSPTVVPPPLDFSDWIKITGYWFLDESDNWEPPKPLSQFIEKARADEKKIVYIGFGSIVVSNAKALTQLVIDAVLKADVRCILSKGWSNKLKRSDSAHDDEDIELPTEVYQIEAAPHDWLFSQVDAVVHHGGAGTTGASLRAGVPTIIRPFFGDQFFFATRVEDLGVGLHMRKLNVSHFSKALWEATRSERLITKAKSMGAQIRSEKGVEIAINSIYRNLEYARSLIKKGGKADAEDEGSEDGWTFVDEDTAGFMEETGQGRM